MLVSDVRRAVAAAVSTASALDLVTDDAVVLHNSNKLTVRLVPCDVIARVTLWTYYETVTPREVSPALYRRRCSSCMPGCGRSM